MKAISQSTLGYIMNFTKTSTTSMAKSLHIDASLVSKWKSGSRLLTPSSMYFDDVIDYLLSQSAESDTYLLEESILHFYPLADTSNQQNVKKYLIKVLSNNSFSSDKNDFILGNRTGVNSYVFNGYSDLCDAVSKMLDFAEAMPVSGELSFVETNSFNWLIHDETFSLNFCQRLLDLLNNGFSAQFIIHFSPLKDDTLTFFKVCHQLLFHRNIKWMYFENYDSQLTHASFYTLNSAISIMHISTMQSQSQSFIFTDANVIMKHKEMITAILPSCHKLFKNYELEKISNVIDDIYTFRRHGSIFAILSAPAFISVEPDLIKKVLISNNVTREKIDLCLSVNQRFRNKINNLESANGNYIYYIFRLESMIKRTMSRFISNSLSLLCNQDIIIKPIYFAEALQNIANLIIANKKMNVILVTENDNVNLPKINCWCNNSSWMLTMDSQGFRLTDEPCIVESISHHLEKSISCIPLVRKDRYHVSDYLLDFANDIIFSEE